MNLHWYHKVAPAPGEPGCLCSLCGQFIRGDETPLMFFADCGNCVVQLHWICAELAMAAGELKLCVEAKA